MTLSELVAKYPQILLDAEDFAKYKSCCAWVDSDTDMLGIYFEGKSYKAHRLVLNAPSHLQVDHIDRNRLNNKKDNLRLATFSTQQFNVPLKSTNSSGHTGVSFHKGSGLWRARLTRNGKEYVTFHYTKELAIVGRTELELIHLKDIRNETC